MTSGLPLLLPPGGRGGVSLSVAGWETIRVSVGSGSAAFVYLLEFWSGVDEDLPSFHRVEDCLSRTGLSMDALTGSATEDGKLKTLRSFA